MKKIIQKTIFLFTTLFLLSHLTHAQELRLEILNGHSGGGVLAVAVSDDGKFALTGSTDQTALLWDLETGKQLRRFFRHKEIKVKENGEEITVFVGHEDAVSAVDFSKDGKFVLTAGYDGSAQLWETATGKQIRYFSEYINGKKIGHYGKILSAKISPDGKFVATAGEDKTARIWDLQTGKQLFQLEHEGRVNSIAFSPDSKYLLTGGEDKIARLYSTETGKDEKQFVGHTEEVTSVDYSPDGKQVLTTGKDLTIKLWNVHNLENIKLPLFFNDVPFAEFVAVGGSIIAKSNSDKLRIWNIASEKVVNQLEDIKDDKHYLNLSGNIFAITRDGRTLLFVTDNTVQIIDLVKSSLSGKLNGNSSTVNDVAISNNSNLILTGSDRNTGLWELNTGKIKTIKIETGLIKEIENEKQQSVKFVKTLANSYMNKLDLPELPLDLGYSKAVVFASDGKRFAIATVLQIRVFNVLDLKEERIFRIGEEVKLSKGKNQGISSVEFSPDNKFVLAGGDKGGKLWKIESKEAIQEFGKTTDMKFSPNSRTIALAGSDKTVRLWNVETGEVKLIIKDFLTPVLSVAFSPDGKMIATASGGEYDPRKVGIGDAAASNSIQFWNIETGEKVGGFGQRNETVHNKFVGFESVAYLSPESDGEYPNGKLVAAGSFDGKVYVHNVETKALKKFEGHTDAVNSVKFAKDAKGRLLVVSGSSDSTTRIWDAGTGEEICALVTFRDGNWAVVQTKTGRYDASNGGDIEGIQWTYGNEVIELSQLSAMYYTPNLLPRLLGYNKENLSEVVPLKDLKLQPEVISQKFDPVSKKLTFTLKLRNGGIGKTEIYVNDSLAVPDARKKKLKDNPLLPKDEIVNLEADLSGSKFGARVCRETNGKENCRIEDNIRIVTSNYLKEIGKGNIRSRGSELINLDEAKEVEFKLPTLYAIVGGVSDYGPNYGGDVKDRLDLNFAAKDAEDFSNALSLGAKRLFCDNSKPDCLDKVQITTLSTSGKEGTIQPTKENFKKAFEEIAKRAKPEDIIVIYLAGHGVSFGTGTDTYFYLTREASSGSKEDLAKVFQTAAISSTELTEWLTTKEWTQGEKGIKALKQVLILDTCAAGEAASQLALTAKRDLSGDQIRAIEFLKDKTGTFVLMGSTADAPSYEASQFGQGLLTYSLLQAIKGDALETGGFIDVRRLFSFAEKEVPKMATNIGGVQKPIVSAPLGKTFVIGQITKSDESKIVLPTLKPRMLRPRLGMLPRNNDPLDLTAQLRKRLDAESSFEVVRRRGDKEPILVYLDDDSLPNGIQVTGTYTIEGDNIKIKAYLFKGDTELAELPKINALKDEVIEKLLALIRTKLPKGN